jgi:hypothetical protein
MTLLSGSPGLEYNSEEPTWWPKSPTTASQAPDIDIGSDSQIVPRNEYSLFPQVTASTTDNSASGRPPKRLAATRARRTLAEAYAPLIIPFDGRSTSSSDDAARSTKLSALPSGSPATIEPAADTRSFVGIDIGSLLPIHNTSDDDSLDDEFVGDSTAAGRGRLNKRARNIGSTDAAKRLRKKKFPRLAKDDMRLVAGTDGRKRRIEKRATKKIAMLEGLKKADAGCLMAWIGAKMDWDEAAAWLHSQRDKKDRPAMVDEAQACFSIGEVNGAEVLKAHWVDVLSKAIPEMYIG